MAEKKCLMCGSTEFVPYTIASGMVGEYDNYVNGYACVNCGFIGLYAQEERLQMILRRNEEKLRREKEKDELQKQVNDLNAKLRELKAIVVDENQTVKAVKEAKGSIIHVENEIRQLQSRIASLSTNRS